MTGLQDLLRQAHTPQRQEQLEALLEKHRDNPALIAELTELIKLAQIREDFNQHLFERAQGLADEGRRFIVVVDPDILLIRDIHLKEDVL